MTSFLQSPNLPDGEVTLAAVSPCGDEICAHLEALGIELIFTEENRLICDRSVAFHADILLHHLWGGRFIVSKEQKALTERLCALGAEVITPFDSPFIGGRYPSDCALNAVSVKNRLLARLGSTDGHILAECRRRGVEALNVRQGYAKCSVCVCSENALITDDPSIKKVCDLAHIDALLISKGDVRLEGREYGFIGGASMKTGKNSLTFFGDITEHRDFPEIKAFLKKHGLEFSYIKGCRLTDVGSALPITQRI